MGGRYAADTSVSSEASRVEIERTLTRYGATAFAYGWDRNAAMVEFVAVGRRIRFVVPLPDPADPSITHTPVTKERRSPENQRKAYEQASRQRWRALALVIKAKLEAVDAKISEFEDEFLAHVVLPDGSTVGETIRPQIAKAYEVEAGSVALSALGTGSG